MALYNKSYYHPTIHGVDTPQSRYDFHYGKEGEKYFIDDSNGDHIVPIIFEDEMKSHEAADIAGTIAGFLAKKEFRETEEGEEICDGFSEDYSVDISSEKIIVTKMEKFYLIGKVKNKEGLETNLVEQGQLLMQDQEIDKYTFLQEIKRIHEFVSESECPLNEFTLEVPIKRYYDRVLVSISYKKVAKIKGTSMVVKAIDAI